MEPTYVQIHPLIAVLVLSVLVAESSVAVLLLWFRKRLDPARPLVTAYTCAALAGLALTLFLIGYVAVAIADTAL